ncbi:MAG: hypothetical protein U5Q44_01060 [Dehalococcoidia bacterium]|nr:hypothetical protein [Dehalococcoidia bacterium]
MDNSRSGPEPGESPGCLEWFRVGFILGSLFAIARNPGGLLACGCLVLLAALLAVAVAVYVAIEYLLPLALLGAIAIIVIWALQNRRRR